MPKLFLGGFVKHNFLWFNTRVVMQWVVYFRGQVIFFSTQCKLRVAQHQTQICVQLGGLKPLKALYRNCSGCIKNDSLKEIECQIITQIYVWCSMLFPDTDPFKQEFIEVFGSWFNDKPCMLTKRRCVELWFILLLN